MHIFEDRIRKNGDQPFVLSYRRINGTGHCLIAKRRRDASPESNERTGSVARSKAEQSYIIFAVFRTPEDDDSNELQINFYSEGTNDVVYHTQLWWNFEFDRDAESQPSSPFNPQPGNPRGSFEYNLQLSSSTDSPDYTYRQNAEAELPPTLKMKRLYLNN
ncbi:hypothetical protein ACEPPN_009359 [Leptodophora sp. 'Broadleaf-Isolate-01']